jgi:RNA polymerase sigma-70 factor (ECF subfamily)
VDEWFRQYGHIVLRYLEHRTDAQTAEDLVQEVFVLAFRKNSTVPIPPVGWLLNTAGRVLANHERGRRRRDQLVRRMAEHSQVTADPGDAELWLRFAEALSNLSVKDREVLTLSGWYGLTPAEAAQALDCSPRTYAVRLHRARTRLAQQVEASGDSRSAADRLAALLHG